jgi:hypothetical protein
LKLKTNRLINQSGAAVTLSACVLRWELCVHRMRQKL